MALYNPTSSLAFWFFSLHLHVILLFSMSLLQLTGTMADTLGNETDRIAVLRFKESISSDPNGMLSSWNDSFHLCDWR